MGRLNQKASLAAAEKFGGGCKGTCWNGSLLGKKITVFKKCYHTPMNRFEKVSYPSHFVVTFFVPPFIPRRLVLGY